MKEIFVWGLVNGPDWAGAIRMFIVGVINIYTCFSYKGGEKGIYKWY